MNPPVSLHKSRPQSGSVEPTATSGAVRPKLGGRYCGGITLSVAVDGATSTCREIRRSCCTYCLGLSACLLVVFVGATLQTLLDQAPLIFMREAESTNGQVDLRLRSAEYINGEYINYTSIAHALASSPTPDQYSYASPRIIIAGVVEMPGTCKLGNYSADGPPYEYAGVDYNYTDSNTWMYERGLGGETPTYCAASCMSLRCDTNSEVRTTIHVIDTGKEERMGYGRKWPFGAIPPGQVVIGNDLAAELGGVQPGDTILVRFSIPTLLRHAFRPTPEAADGDATTSPIVRSGVLPEPTPERPKSPDYAWAERAGYHFQVSLSLRVFGVSASEGKTTDSTRMPLFMEMDNFISWVAPRLHPLIRHVPGVADSAGVDGNLHFYATEVNLNIPPEDRLLKYTDSNYDNIQKTVVTYANGILYLSGFPVVSSSLPILSDLRRRRFVSLYLGLLMNILLFIMFALSCLLIYSLLLINVGSRTFELAIRRMLGTSRPALIMLLVFQALAYSIPSWVLGLLIAQGLTAMMMGQFAEISGLPVALSLTPAGIMVGTLLALGVPLLAAIGPISGALSTNLRDALDVYRPKSQAVKYNIERADAAGVSWSIVAIGTSLSVFGFSIYYLIPLSLLSLNLSLFFNIFFAILLGMLFGLVLLALNMEITLEKMVVYLTLFWDRPVMRKLAISNLISHRVRNRKTMVMYALSIAFIVFITTAANMEIRSAVFVARQEAGSVIVLENDSIQAPDMETIAAVEAVLAKPEWAPHITSTAYLTHTLHDIVERADRGDNPSVLTNEGRVYEVSPEITGVSPGFISASFSEYYNPGSTYEGTSLTPTEQLYTIRGSQGVIVGGSYETELGLTLGETVVLEQEQEVATGDGGSFQNGVFGQSTETEKTTFLRPLDTSAMLDGAAVFSFSSIPGRTNDALVSLPTLIRFTNGLVKTPAELPLWRLMIGVTTEFEEDTASVEQFAAELQLAIGDDLWDVDQLSSDVEDLGTTQDIMNFLFATLAVVALFLCFFSLMASMVTNIREQMKEAGVLRALGLTSGRLIRVFVYEAFSLVMASSFMGVAIGVIVGWTFSQQRALFTELPVAFWIPWQIILVVCLAAIVCSLLAAALPGKVITRYQVTELLRTVT